MSYLLLKLLKIIIKKIFSKIILISPFNFIRYKIEQKCSLGVHVHFYIYRCYAHVVRWYVNASLVPLLRSKERRKNWLSNNYAFHDRMRPSFASSASFSARISKGRVSLKRWDGYLEKIQIEKGLLCHSWFPNCALLSILPLLSFLLLRERTRLESAFFISILLASLGCCVFYSNVYFSFHILNKLF